MAGYSSEEFSDWSDGPRNPADWPDRRRHGTRAGVSSSDEDSEDGVSSDIAEGRRQRALNYRSESTRPYERDSQTPFNCPSLQPFRDRNLQPRPARAALAEGIDAVYSTMSDRMRELSGEMSGLRAEVRGLRDAVLSSATAGEDTESRGPPPPYPASAAVAMNSPVGDDE
jgi:hypothetical protein